MSPKSITAVAVTTALLLSPIAVAWSSYGAYEPDTVYDTATWMWQEPGPASADRVYFNGWTSTYALFSPNVGALETSNEAPSVERHNVILGVWVDCNGDGYVGHAESALYEYDRALLLDDSACPPVDGDRHNWTAGAHNYNGWVSELIPIGRPSTDEGIPSDTRVYVDADARIWADQNRPWDAPRGTCALNPFPRGTMQSTGGLLNFLDCRYEVIDYLNLVLLNVPGGEAFAFPDDENAQGAPLDVDTFGSEDTDRAAVSVVDCSSTEPMVNTAENVNDTGAQGPLQTVLDAGSDNTPLDLGEGWEYYKVTVATIDPRLMNTQDPTAPGQYNQTNEEVFEDCDTSNDNGHDFYGTLNEGDWIGNGGDSGKTTATWQFGYFEGVRGDAVNFLGEDSGLLDGGSAGRPMLSQGNRFLQPNTGTGWTGGSNFVKQGPASVVVRADAENPSVGLAPPYYLTFYASVGAATTGSFDLPGGTGIYGAERCNGADDGVVGGWNCDADDWNRNADGTPLPNRENLPTVHDPYNLRDIDCYDGWIGLVGVGASFAAYGDEPCERPA